MAKTHRKPKHQSPTLRQQFQRELAWLLYISEGYVGNLTHAAAVNAFTLPEEDLDMLGEMITLAEANAKMVRDRLNQLRME